MFKLNHHIKTNFFSFFFLLLSNKCRRLSKSMCTHFAYHKHCTNQKEFTWMASRADTKSELKKRHQHKRAFYFTDWSGVSLCVCISLYVQFKKRKILSKRHLYISGTWYENILQCACVCFGASLSMVLEGGDKICIKLIHSRFTWIFFLVFKCISKEKQSLSKCTFVCLSLSCKNSLFKDS